MRILGGVRGKVVFFVEKRGFSGKMGIPGFEVEKGGFCGKIGVLLKNEVFVGFWSRIRGK